MFLLGALDSGVSTVMGTSSRENYRITVTMVSKHDNQGLAI